MSAIPAGLHYEAKPAAIPVYRRRCITSAISSNEYHPGQTIKIPLDTAMHGSVLDTKQTMLQFQLQIKNMNPFVDYINFGRSGAAGIFSGFRFMVNGNPVEKINNYAEIFEDMMIKLNLNGEPYHFFHPNPYMPEEGPLHTNFIKPPMVDCMGNTMYRPQMLLDAASAPNVFFGNLSSKQDVDTNRKPQKKTDQYGSNAQGIHLQELQTKNTISTDEESELNLMSSVFHYIPPGGFLTDGIQTRNEQGTKELLSTRSFHLDRNIETGFTSDNGFPYCAQERMKAVNRLYFNATSGALPVKTGQSNGVAELGLQQAFRVTGEICIHEGILGQQAIVGDPKRVAQIPYSVHTPAEWPYFIPREIPKTPSYSHQRLQDVTRYYSNCKSIPVGMGSDFKYAQYIADTSEMVVDSNTRRNVNLNVVVPLYSGVLGLGADKMFPDMLIAPGKAWLELDLVDHRRAFYVTMDPCRRVPGTIRDYVPYTGTRHGVPRFDSYAHNTFLGPQRILPFYRLTHLHSDMNTELSYPAAAAMFIQDDINASVTAGTPLSGVPKQELPILQTRCYNNNACKGEHYMVHGGSSQLYPFAGIDVLEPTHNANHTAYDHGTKFLFHPAEFKGPVGISGKNGASQFPGGFLTAFKIAREVGAGMTGPGDMDDEDQVEFALFPMQNLSTVGGIPIPQYVPVKDPWTVKDSRVNCYYVPERESCYGTYLKQAVAQTSRTSMATNNFTVASAQYTTYVTSYGVSNVELITEQILLPDAVTSQILDGASAGAIAYHTTFTNSLVQLANESHSQNQLLTVTGASVNNLTLLFRSTAQLNADNSSQSYNSLAFYNPFASVLYDATLPTDTIKKSGGKYDVGGKYTINHALSTRKGENLNMQLKIGNEFIPRTPIKDLPTLLMENEKGVQTIADYTSKLPYYCPSICTTSTNSSSEAFFDYNCLDDGFLAAFVPADALDDQTITGNPFFASVDLDLFNTRVNPTTTGAEFEVKTAGLRCPPDSKEDNVMNGTYQGVFNRFTPLEGTFHICFNLDTFVLEGGSARCGTTIVNNQLFWKCESCYFMSHKIGGYSPKVEILAIWQQDAKIVFEAGGNCVSYI